MFENIPVIFIILKRPKSKDKVNNTRTIILNWTKTFKELDVHYIQISLIVYYIAVIFGDPSRSEEVNINSNPTSRTVKPEASTSVGKLRASPGRKKSFKLQNIETTSTLSDSAGAGSYGLLITFISIF